MPTDRLERRFGTTLVAPSAASATERLRRLRPSGGHAHLGEPAGGPRATDLEPALGRRRLGIASEPRSQPRQSSVPTVFRRPCGCARTQLQHDARRRRGRAAARRRARARLVSQGCPGPRRRAASLAVLLGSPRSRAPVEPGHAGPRSRARSGTRCSIGAALRRHDAPGRPGLGAPNMNAAAHARRSNHAARAVVALLPRSRTPRRPSDGAVAVDVLQHGRLDLQLAAGTRGAQACPNARARGPRVGRSGGERWLQAEARAHAACTEVRVGVAALRTEQRRRTAATSRRARP